MRLVLKEEFFHDFVGLQEAADEELRTDFTLEFFVGDAVGHMRPLFDLPALPLKKTPIQLHRERRLTGWVFGDQQSFEFDFAGRDFCLRIGNFLRRKRLHFVVAVCVQFFSLREIVQ